jgi:hypothetical protein
MKELNTAIAAGVAKHPSSRARPLERFDVLYCVVVSV